MGKPPFSGFGPQAPPIPHSASSRQLKSHSVDPDQPSAAGQLQTGRTGTIVPARNHYQELPYVRFPAGVVRRRQAMGRARRKHDRLHAAATLQCVRLFEIAPVCSRCVRSAERLRGFAGSCSARTRHGPRQERRLHFLKNRPDESRTCPVQEASWRLIRAVRPASGHLWKPSAAVAPSMCRSSAPMSPTRFSTPRFRQ